MNKALQITGLSKSFPGFSLKNISLELPEGYIMGLIGPNGAGKTTLIKLILNMMKKDAGEIKVFGLDHANCEEEIKENLGVVSEQPNFLERWTLKELGNTIGPFYRTWDTQKYCRYLEEFSLNPDLRIKSLSKGMKMKLMIAAALSHDTRLLILDEPTGGLDAVSRDELLNILRNYVTEEDKSVLLSSHITADLDKAADYITFLYQGEMIYTGTKDGLLESYCIVKGDRKDLTPEQRACITGYTEYPNGFEGLLKTEDMKGLSRNITTDTVTLDDIILFTDRGRKEKGVS